VLAKNTSQGVKIWNRKRKHGNARFYFDLSGNATNRWNCVKILSKYL